MSDWLTSDIRQAFLNKRVTLWLGPCYGWKDGTPGDERPRDEHDDVV
ncbi:MAG: hypothetical protein HQ592_07350 [Planctomycetes bacterium]|nr:hypothetical protein [Planctomycetota bacterium]